MFRMLGFSSFNFTTKSQFGIVPKEFGMDNVKCSGFESDIRDCPHDTTDDCSADEGAGMICS
jgi:hypothetical protein